jgi:hypothetical protein
MKFWMRVAVCFFCLAAKANADLPYYSGFCWAETSSGVHCSPIYPSPSVPIQNYACAKFAASLGSTHSGGFRNTNVNALILAQEQNCNDVNQQPKFDCFLEERCDEAGGVTSSLSPLHRSVFSQSGNVDLARKACVDKAQSLYSDALKSAGLNCLIGARAVMTLPKGL